MELDLNNKEWQDALQIIRFTHRSLFLTGKAGTGKSTFLRYVAEHTKKKYGAQNETYLCRWVEK